MNQNIIQALVGALANFKSGWKTSEFWVALSPIVVGILSVFGVNVDNAGTTHFVVAVWGGVAAVYVAARTFLKSVHLSHAANLAGILKQLEQSIIEAVGVQPVAKQEAPKTPVFSTERNVTSSPVRDSPLAQ